MDFQQLRILYKNALVQDVIPFWKKNSIDKQFGGYFTCLDKTGTVYDTDKFVWLQARQVWTFSMLYNRLQKNAEWLDIAAIGANFLIENGQDEAGNWYFSLDRSGRPLVAPYNIFSDCFAAMALSQYGNASNDDRSKTIAQTTFENILRRKTNPKGAYNKAISATRPLKSLALPMILCNLAMEMRGIVQDSTIDCTIDETIDEVMLHFLDNKSMRIFENVLPDGSHCDCFEGRVINPGHSIEAMWFILDIAHNRNDSHLINKAVDVILNTLDFGWDRIHGGIFYFLDSQGKPPQQLEWDQKLWWVHAEALVALLMAFRLTRKKECLDWFQKVHDYTWGKFPDAEHGEWFGYLNRQGEVLLNLKGGKWKGCFHVPRSLYLCQRELASIIDLTAQ